MAAAALEQSVLESKDKDTLLEMAKALGVNMSVTVTAAEEADSEERLERPNEDVDNVRPYHNDEVPSTRRKKRRTFDTAFNSLMQQESPTLR